MVEEHKEENEELKEEDREKQVKTIQRQVEVETHTEREREGEGARKTEAALRLFQTMTGNVAKDSHIVQQDTVQYIGSITDNSVSSK